MQKRRKCLRGFGNARKNHAAGLHVSFLVSTMACLIPTVAGCATSRYTGEPVPQVYTAEPANPATPGFDDSDGHRRRKTPATIVRPLTAEEHSVLESAFALLDKPPDAVVIVNGRKFILDCIGTVSAIFYRLGIDITKDFSRYQGNGVSRLYKSLESRNAVHSDYFPRPGDIVFWNNTWDRNGDGIQGNDPTTHAGVVLFTEEDGTIHYIHEHVRRGIIVERMNLFHPDVYYDEHGKILNNAMAMGSYFGNPHNPAHWLSGDLWYRFGGVLRIKDAYRVK